MKTSPALVAVALLAALSLPAVSQNRPDGAMAMESSAPGHATFAGVVKLTGTVEAIDLQTRHVTVKGPHGRTATLEIGPDARNFDQIKVGDQVVLRYVQALSLTLMKNGKELRSNSADMAGDRSPAGQRPAGAVGRQVEVTADVVAVNRKSKMVTLRGPEHEVDLKVEDPAQLKLIKVGDQVHAVYTEAVALSVEPAAPKKK